MSTRVAVVGLGYTGCVTAACLARLGHRVVGVDKDSHKVEKVRNGKAPFFEPGLEELVEQEVASGRLAATTSMKHALDQAEVALLCIGTPSDRNGDIGLDQLRRVVGEIGAVLLEQPDPLVIGVRSTIFPGTCEDLAGILGAAHPRVSFVANPEFLREGSALRDFMEPPLVVVGGSDPAAVALVAGLYASLPIPASLISLRGAELIKYACNAFHAVKITFANEIGAMAGRLGVPGDEVMKVFCQDLALNLGPSYLRPGFAFGGSCLPKDLRALIYRAGRLGLRLPLLEAPLPSNQEHLRRAVEAAVALPERRIGIVGLAFKENTDDLRESPAFALVERLIAIGREVRVFDPHIRLADIYGANREFLLRALPDPSSALVEQLDDLLGWAERLIVTQNPGGAVAERMVRSGLPVLDLTRSPDRWTS